MKDNALSLNSTAVDRPSSQGDWLYSEYREDFPYRTYSR